MKDAGQLLRDAASRYGMAPAGCSWACHETLEDEGVGADHLCCQGSNRGPCARWQGRQQGDQLGACWLTQAASAQHTLSFACTCSLMANFTRACLRRFIACRRDNDHQLLAAGPAACTLTLCLLAIVSRQAGKLLPGCRSSDRAWLAAICWPQQMHVWCGHLMRDSLPRKSPAIGTSDLAVLLTAAAPAKLTACLRAAHE